MGRLDNMQKAIYEVKNLIQSSKNIRKLLLHDTTNALNSSDIEYADADEYIVVSPVFDMTKSPFNKNTIISIALAKGVEQEKQLLNST
ncbi:hypothetical protein DRO61_11800, partial [Candidatus Bathyarchaeota archaeon]